MSRIKCKACGRSYESTRHDCCPDCGAYNRPPRKEKVMADGYVAHVEPSVPAKKPHKSWLPTGPLLKKTKSKTPPPETTETQPETPQAPEANRFSRPADDYREETENRFDEAEGAIRQEEEDSETVNELLRQMNRNLNQVLNHMEDQEKPDPPAETPPPAKRLRRPEKKTVIKWIAIVVGVLLCFYGIFTVLRVIGNAVGDTNMSDVLEELHEPIPVPPPAEKPHREPRPDPTRDPDEFASITKGMEWMSPNKSLRDNEKVYGVNAGQPFLLGDSVATVDRVNIESGQEMYGFGQIVTIHVTFSRGKLPAPSIYYQSGAEPWKDSYYWEKESDGHGVSYEYLISSDTPEAQIILVFENYTDTEVQVFVQ